MLTRNFGRGVLVRSSDHLTTGPKSWHNRTFCRTSWRNCVTRFARNALALSGGPGDRGSHGSRRDNLSSPGSCHPVHQDAEAHAQWAKSKGYWLETRCQAALAFFMGRSRLYLSRSQRIR